MVLLQHVFDASVISVQLIHTLIYSITEKPGVSVLPKGVWAAGIVPPTF